MISKDLRNLFQFIDFLYSNIDNFNQFNKTVLEYKRALQETYFLDSVHYTELIKHREAKKKVDIKEDELYNKMVKPIEDEVERLGVFIMEKPNNVYNSNDLYEQYYSEIFNLIDTFDESEIDVIIKAKRQYLSFRNKVNNNIISYRDFIILFTNLDTLMSMTLEPFHEEGDKDFPKIERVSYAILSIKPDSLNLPLKLNEVEVFYKRLLKEDFAVIQKETDLAHFAYAINGEEIPIEKLPYKPVRLINTVDSMYIELLELMKNHNIISQDNKTIPKKYRDLAEHLFLNSAGKPLKLRTPK